MIIRRAQAGDLEALRGFAERTFRVAFEHLNEPSHFEAYMEKAFAPAHFKSEFEHPGSEYWLLELEGRLAAYLKFNTDKTAEGLIAEPNLEIERIYVDDAIQGGGLGQELIKFSLQRAGALGVRWLWLGVWERNLRAISFYKRHGFEVFGSHAFALGDDIQTDLLMRREIEQVLPGGSFF